MPAEAPKANGVEVNINGVQHHAPQSEIVFEPPADLGTVPLHIRKLRTKTKLPFKIARTSKTAAILFARASKEDVIRASRTIGEIDADTPVTDVDALRTKGAVSLAMLLADQTLNGSTQADRARIIEQAGVLAGITEATTYSFDSEHPHNSLPPKLVVYSFHSVSNTDHIPNYKPNEVETDVSDPFHLGDHTWQLPVSTFD